MINRYLVPCRYCGGTVEPDSGTVEQVGQLWLGAHVSCADQNRCKISLFTGDAPPQPRRSPAAGSGITHLNLAR